MKNKVGEKMTVDEAMNLAIEVAREGLGFVSPNPLVGCVALDSQDRLLASGAHLKFGEAHAEINAIKKLENNSKLEGAKLFVTLEPCAHEGNTGSCAKALAKLPIKKVYYGLLDPNPLVAGKGLEILSAAGIEVEQLSAHTEAIEKLTEQFLFHIKNKRPYVSLKAGVSLDGKIALNSGESQWITSPESRLHARELRAHYDATLIGAGTFINDNPSLDFRETIFAGKKKNKIIIFDPKAKAIEAFDGSKLVEIHGAENISVITQSKFKDAWSKKSVQFFEWENSSQGWSETLKQIYLSGIASLFVEGGAFAFSQFMQYQLAQKLYLYQAPKILGAGKSWSESFQIESLKSAPCLQCTSTSPVGSDQLFIGYF